MTEVLRASEGLVLCARGVLDAVGRHLAARVAEGGRVSAERMDAVAPEAFALARHLAQTEAASAVLEWGRRLGRLEEELAATYVALAAQDLERWLQFQGESLGVDEGVVVEPFRAHVASTLASGRLAALAGRLVDRGPEALAGAGLSEEHAAVRREFARFADERLAPLAESIHRGDRLVPEDLLQDLSGLGVFGISIPEAYGGSFVDHQTMVIATEELSRGSLGAGGSVITRPEICAKAILKGGTEDQKRRWLPAIASGKRMVCVTVTEPDHGSDVASIRVSARRDGEGYRIRGEKTWCTFAGRSDLLCLLARTGTPEEGHRGLSLFLVEKPPRTSAEGGEYAFDHAQEGGGRMSARAIPTIGYRGMHSFAVAFEDWHVPLENRIGEEGQGFYLQMEGFAGGRIQTAARALGVMEAAFRAALRYAWERRVFGRALLDHTLTRVRLVEMAARIQAARQLAYAVGRAMDAGGGAMLASLVKLLACRDAEWVTREAMQLHGGMGYSEEYAVSRYWLDARVLSIFEGAEEVLALLVIARPFLGERLPARV